MATLALHNKYYLELEIYTVYIYCSCTCSMLYRSIRYRGITFEAATRFSSDSSEVAT